MQSDVRNLNHSYEATAGSVARARTSLSDFAAAVGATPEQVDGVRLAVSEAMTNAILHAYPNTPGQIHVNAAIVSDQLWILIADEGCGLEPRTSRPGLGLGLGLISQVADDFAIVSRAAGGTEVRIRFTLSAATSGADSSERPTGTGREDYEPPQRRGFTASVSVA